MTLQIRDRVARWSQDVSREMNATDYLAKALNSPQLVDLLQIQPGEGEGPFSPDEVEYVLQRLDEIETHILSLRDGSQQFENAVRTGIGQLKEQARQSDRRTFRMFVFSTLLAIGLAFFTSTQTQEIIQFATSQINTVNTTIINTSTQNQLVIELNGGD